MTAAASLRHAGHRFLTPRLFGTAFRRDLSAAARCQSNPLESTAIASTALREQPRDLLHLIRQHIRAHGPLPVPRYMSLCLGHPTLGYYTRVRDREDGIFGKAGDFITSPEISQVFGEMLAIHLISQWLELGSQPRVRIIELGPGRGTLMADVLRVRVLDFARSSRAQSFRAVKSFTAQIDSIHLVETSPYLRQRQKTALADLADPSTLHWHDSLPEIEPQHSECFTIIIAHEFFDALPVHVFEKRPQGWREVMVVESTTERGLVSSQPLKFALSPGETLAANLFTRDLGLAAVADGTRVEICAEADSVAARLAQLVSGPGGGTGVVIDYGDDHHFGNSLRGFRNHQIVDPLSQPGETDLTANVDFARLRRSLGDKVTVNPLVTQQHFLSSLGMGSRVERLLSKAKDQDEADLFLSSAVRLVDPVGMGSQYKVLGFQSTGTTGAQS